MLFLLFYVCTVLLVVLDGLVVSRVTRYWNIYLSTSDATLLYDLQ